MNPFDSGSVRRSNFRRSNSEPTPPRAPRPEGEVASWLSCDVVALDLVAYFDSQADDQAALRARRHLDACAECSRMWRDWGDSRLLLRTAQLPEMPVDWPASLVQRARLQAMLPALFAARDTDAAVDASEDSALAPDGVHPPRELRQTILARTTRAVETRPANDSARSNARQAAVESKVLDPSRAGGLRARRCRMAKRACASALAAWMLVAASSFWPERTGHDERLAAFQAQPEPSTGSLRRSTGASFASPLSPLLPLFAVAQRRAIAAQAARAASKAALAAQPAAAPGDESAPPPGTVSQLSPLEADSSTPASAAPAENSASDDTDAASTGPMSNELDSARLSEGSPPVQVAPQPVREAQDAPLAPGTREEIGAIGSGPASAAHPMPSADSRNLSGQNIAIALAARAANVANQGGQNPARASMPMSQDHRAMKSAQDGGESHAWQGAEHEPAVLSRELNDTRPAEIGDAMDAYAATYADEDEGSLQSN